MKRAPKPVPLALVPGTEPAPREKGLRAIPRRTRDVLPRCTVEPQNDDDDPDGGGSSAAPRGVFALRHQREGTVELKAWDSAGVRRLRLELAERDFDRSFCTMLETWLNAKDPVAPAAPRFTLVRGGLC